jgi:hypothetical protein
LGCNDTIRVLVNMLNLKIIKLWIFFCLSGKLLPAESILVSGPVGTITHVFLSEDSRFFKIGLIFKSFYYKSFVLSVDIVMI